MASISIPLPIPIIPLQGIIKLNRLIFEPLAAYDSIYSIALKKFKKRVVNSGNISKHHVKLHILNKDNQIESVWVKIASLSIRLTLKSESLIAAAKEDSLTSLIHLAIDKKRNQEIYIQRVLEDVKKAGFSFTAENVVTKESRELTESEFMALARLACQTSVNALGLALLRIKVNQTEQEVLITKDVHRRFDYEFTSLINLTSNRTLLGNGSFGKVYSVRNYLGGPLLALKICSPCSILATYVARAEIKREVYMLPMIHCDTCTKESKIIPGIQLPPKAFIHFKGGRMGYLSYKYDCNLARFISLEPKDLVGVVFDPDENFNRLILAIIHLKNIGIVHPDIKSRNILMRKNDNNTAYVCDLADFGGACILNSDESRKDPLGCRTPSYFTKTDMTSIQNTANFARKHLKDESAQKAYEDTQLQSMVYALGLSLYEMYLKIFISERDKEGIRIKNIRDHCEELEKQKSGTESDKKLELRIRNLKILEQMIHPDPKARISVEALEKIMD